MLETLDNLRATLIEFGAVYDPAYPMSADLSNDLYLDTRRAADGLLGLAGAIRQMNPHRIALESEQGK